MDPTCVSWCLPTVSDLSEKKQTHKRAGHMGQGCACLDLRHSPDCCLEGVHVLLVLVEQVRHTRAGELQKQPAAAGIAACRNYPGKAVDLE